MKKTIFTLGSIFFFRSGYAQDLDPTIFAETIISPQFFITVIAGVILALGFQFILTALSVAAGISAIGDVKENYVSSKNHSGGKKHFNESEDRDGNEDEMPMRKVVTTSFGIWSTLTLAISLFGATALALNLSLIANPLIGATLALVIWATFFILLFYLETKVVNTMIGGLINAATSGLRSSASAVKDMFTPSDATKIEHMADHTIEKVRKEFQNNFDSDMLNNSIDEFFAKFDKKVPNYEKVKNDISQIVEESVDKVNDNNTKNSGNGSSPGKWMAVQSVLNNAISESSDDKSQEGQDKTQQLKRLSAELKEAYGEGNTKKEKAQKVISKLTPADEEQVGNYINKIKEFLAKDGSSDMDAKQMGDRVKEIIKNPKVETSKIGQKLKELDRSTIIALISENSSLEQNQLEQYADKIEKAFSSLQDSFTTGNSGNISEELKNQVEGLLNKLSGNNSGSNFNFAQLSSILQSKMDNQKDNLDDIKNRLLHTNKEDVIALVTNNSKIDREDIDNVVNSFEEAKSNVLKKIEEIEDTARGKLKLLERKAVIQAEHARETAAAAAWWLVVSAVFSACAALGGSMLTIF